MCVCVCGSLPSALPGGKVATFGLLFPGGRWGGVATHKEAVASRRMNAVMPLTRGS